MFRTAAGDAGAEGNHVCASAGASGCVGEKGGDKKHGRKKEVRKKRQTEKKKKKKMFWTAAGDAGADRNRVCASTARVCQRGCKRLCGGGREATRKMGVK